MSKYIEKPWGLMKKFEHRYGESNCWLGFMRQDGATSVHRHACDSVVSCVSGQILVTFFGDGEKPDFDCQHTEWLAEGESIDIVKSVWHLIRYMGGREMGERDDSREAIFHEVYDLSDEEHDYPIERYEGAAS